MLLVTIHYRPESSYRIHLLKANADPNIRIVVDANKRKLTFSLYLAHKGGVNQVLQGVCPCGIREVRSYPTLMQASVRRA